MNFKKISAIAASALMVGMTMGTAVAASSFPAPFVSNGASNVAIVYGTGTGVSQSDQVQAGVIETYLKTKITSGSSTVVAGDSYQIQKDSDKFNLGNALNYLKSGKIDGTNIDFLADGVYDNGDVDNIDYTQEITLGAQTLAHFAASKYNDKEPTFGFKIAKGSTILDYTIDFDEAVLFANMNLTDMPLMGGKYYVAKGATTTLTLFDAADKVTLKEGDVATIDGKSVEISYMNSNGNGVKFTVDGVTTTELKVGEYKKLSDNSYIVANDIMYAAKESGVSKAEVSIVKNKLVLTSGAEVKMNDETVEGLTATITENAANTGIDKIKLTWKADAETYLTTESSLLMPGFEKIQLAFGGLTFPSTSEAISFVPGETLELDMGNFDLPVAWYNDTASADTVVLGEEDHLLNLAVNADGANKIYVDGTNQTGDTTADTLKLADGGRFIATRINDDLSDSETVYYEVAFNSFVKYNDFSLVLEDQIGDKDFTFKKVGDEFDNGEITIKLLGFNQNDTFVDETSSANGSVYFDVTHSDGSVLDFSKVISDTGLVVTLDATEIVKPKVAGTAGVEALSFREADKDGKLNKGAIFSVDLKVSTNDELYAIKSSASTVGTGNPTLLETSKDNYEGYVASDLATKITTDESGDEDTYDIAYYGDEVTAAVYIGTDITTTTPTTSTLVIMDSEVTQASSKNLIVVGGSCINSVAARLVGGAHCGKDFTTATNGIGAGQFLIKSYNSPYAEGKVALLVAGYDAADTANAATYLKTHDIDTTVAQQGYVGSSSTAAELKVTSA